MAKNNAVVEALLKIMVEGEPQAIEKLKKVKDELTKLFDSADKRPKTVNLSKKLKPQVEELQKSVEDLSTSFIAMARIAAQSFASVKGSAAKAAKDLKDKFTIAEIKDYRRETEPGLKEKEGLVAAEIRDYRKREEARLIAQEKAERERKSSTRITSSWLPSTGMAKADSAKLKEYFGGLEKEATENLKRIGTKLEFTKLTSSFLPSGAMSSYDSKRLKDYFGSMEKEGEKAEKQLKDKRNKQRAEAERRMKKPLDLDVFRASTMGNIVTLRSNKEMLEKELKLMKSGGLEQFKKTFPTFAGADIKELKEAFISYKALLSSGIKDANKDLSGHQKGFANMTQNILRDTKELIKWQARWYGAKMLLFKPLEMGMKGAKDFVEWEQGMKNVQAVSQTSTKDMKKLEEVTMDIGRTTPISAKEASKAMLEFAQAGVDVNTIQQALPVSAKLVVATQEDMSTAVSALTTVYKVWKADASNMAGVGDMLAASMAASKLKVADLSTIFNYLASTSNMANIGLKDTLTLVTALSQAGVKSSTIGTGLSTLISRLSAPTPKLLEQLGKKGLGMKDIAIPENNIIDVLKKMKKAGVDIVDLFKGIEMRGGRTAAALLQQIDDIDKIASQIGESGILNKMFGVSMEGIQNQFKRMGNVIQNIFIEIGRGSLGGIQSVVTLLSDLVDTLELVISSSESLRNKFYSLDDGTKKIILALTALKDVFVIFIEMLVLGSEVILRGVVYAFKVLGVYIGGVGAALNAIFQGDFSGAATIISETIKDATLKTEKYLESLEKSSTGVWNRLGDRVDSFMGKIDKMYNKIKPEDLYGPDYTYAPGPNIKIPNPDPNRDKKSKGLSFSQLYSTFDKAYKEAIKIVKDDEKEILDIQEYYQKLGYNTYIENIEAKKNASIDANNFEIALLTAQLYELDSLYEKSKGKFAGKEEENADAMTKAYEDYQNKKTEILRRIDEAEKENDKKVRDATVDIYYFQKEKYIEFINWKMNYENRDTENAIDLYSKRNDKVMGLLAWLNDKRLLSDSQMYDTEKNFIAADFSMRSDALDKELARFMEVKTQELYYVQKGSKEEQKIKDEILNKEQDTNQKRLMLEEDYYIKEQAIMMKYKDKPAWRFEQEGVGGVFSLEIEKLNAQFGDMGQNLIEAMDGVAQGMFDGFKTFFFDAMTGQLKTFEDYIKSFANSVAQTLSQLASKMLMQTIVGGIGSLLGMGGLNMTGATLGGGMGVTGPTDSLGFMASGGRVSLNKSYIVGEKGPELFRPGVNGSIIPNNALGSSPNVAVNVINQTGTDATAQQQGNIRFDGDKYIVDVVMKKMNNSLEFRNFMRGR